MASEDVVLSLLKAKCLPVLLYATEVCPINSRDKGSFDFTLTRVLMKVFRTKSVHVIKHCQLFFNLLPFSYLADIRAAKFLFSYLSNNNSICQLFCNSADAALKKNCEKYGDFVFSIGALHSKVYELFLSSI